MPLRACAPCDPAFAPVASRRAVPPGSYVPKHRNAGRHGFRSCAVQTDTPAANAGRPAKSGAQPPPSGGLVPRSTLPARIQTERDYLTQRAGLITRHFPNAMGMDDFMHRVEIALYAFGFSGDNSIAMVNLCRDEVTLTLKQRIDAVFGSSFNTNGLGGVLTCGVTGINAGLSHAPVCKDSGRERYVFFSFPHIGIDAHGVTGRISRPGRPGASCACGALAGALGSIKADGLAAACKVPGVHEPLDPEMTILKQRLARRLRHEGVAESGVQDLDLVGMTKVAERTITDDLEYLIEKTVDPGRADYAIVTGVQIHSWGAAYDDAAPNLEFVAPGTIQVVTAGVTTHIDLGAVPALTPRQVNILADPVHAGGAGAGGAGAAGAAGGAGAGLTPTVCDSAGHTTLREIEPPFMYASAPQRQRRMMRLALYARDLEAEQGPTQASTQPEDLEQCQWPSWQSRLRAQAPHRANDSSLHIDHASFDISE